MDDKIVFEDNKQSNNDELLKENTPETIDYNKLYNINENSTNNSNIQGNNQYNNNNEQIINKTNENNPTISNNISENNPTINNNEKKKEKSNMSNLLFIFLVFLIIMGVIIFLFPFIGKLLVN